MNKLAGISRRGFLVGGGIAAIAAGLTTLGISYIGTDEDYRSFLGGEVPEVLNTWEFAVLTIFASHMITPASGFPSVYEARVARRVDRELSFASEKLRGDVKSSLLYLEYAGLLSGEITKFSKKKPADQIAAIRALQGSTSALERSIYSGLRFLCLFFYYSDTRVWPAVGYSGPMVPYKFFPAGNTLNNLPPLASNS